MPSLNFILKSEGDEGKERSWFHVDAYYQDAQLRLLYNVPTDKLEHFLNQFGCVDEIRVTGCISP